MNTVRASAAINAAQSLLAPDFPTPQQIFCGEETVAGFKKAMRRLTSTVTIITTAHRGERFGMVATAVSSVSAEPPSIVIGVNHSASLFEPLIGSGRFAVNMLECADASLIAIFGGQIKGQERFNHGQWIDADDIPSLASAQATLICTVAKTLTYGSHELIIGTIEHVRVKEAISPLLWQDGQPAHSSLLSL